MYFLLLCMQYQVFKMRTLSSFTYKAKMSEKNYIFLDISHPQINLLCGVCVFLYSKVSLPK